MSQEQNEQTRRARRIARTQRNRPILVTDEVSGVALDEQQSTLPAEPAPSTDGTSSSVAEKTRETGTRRRLGFFSTIGKNNETSEQKEAEVAQARIARAVRSSKGGNATAKGETPQTGEKTEEKKPARATSSTSGRPASAFKTRYIIGMALYLLAANFIGAYEVQFMRSIHADRTLTTFDLFGGKVIINTSTLVFLATLIIILVLLARLDLIPRSLTGAAGGRSNTTANTRVTQSGVPAPRYTPPSVRQGVKGTDDKLYQAYRTSQRRDKKR